jgi:hypothetical protein
MRMCDQKKRKHQAGISKAQNLDFGRRTVGFEDFHELIDIL